MNDSRRKDIVIWTTYGITLTALLIVIYYPVVIWMHERFRAAETYYSHGLLIPLVSAGLVFRKVLSLKSISLRGSAHGLWLIAGGLLIHLICTIVQVYFISGFTVILVIYGACLYLFGPRLVRIISFPILFLVFMVPLPLVALNTITVPLKIFVTDIVVILLRLILRIPVSQQGFQIILPNASLVVENPCSGLRSIIVMLALGAVFSYTLHTPLRRRVWLFLMSIPIAICANIIRVLILALSVYIYGTTFTDRYVHDASGYLMFIMAFLGFWSLWRVLQCSDSK